MTDNTDSKIILMISITLSILVTITSAVGIYTTGFYSRETTNWQSQSIGQDIVDLFLIVPCLLITSVLAFRKNKIAVTLRIGVVLYLTYTFMIFCLDVRFNEQFVMYCIVLGLSFYSLIHFLITQIAVKSQLQFESRTIYKLTGIYFIIISVGFCFLWLSEIVAAIINNTIPESLKEAGLFTNPVHVLDLAILLPGIFITGILILRKRSLGLIFTPVILTFFILMDITIGALIFIMKARGIEADPAPAIAMALLALLSLVLLILFFKSMRPQSTET